MTTKVKINAKKLSERSGISEKLVRAVLRQLGGGPEAWDSLRDVCRGGADAGFCGFTYYSDTVEFFRKYRREITALCERMADDLGENVSDMVAGFGCLGGQDLRVLQHKHHYSEIPNHERREALREYMPSVSRCLYGGRLTDDDDLVANALAWFALEEVARAAEDFDE